MLHKQRLIVALGTTTVQEVRRYQLLHPVMGFQEQGEDVTEELAHAITAEEALWVSRSMGQTPCKEVDQTIGGIIPLVAMLESKVKFLSIRTHTL